MARHAQQQNEEHHFCKAYKMNENLLFHTHTPVDSVYVCRINVREMKLFGENSVKRRESFFIQYPCMYVWPQEFQHQVWESEMFIWSMAGKHTCNWPITTSKVLCAW